MVAAAPATSFGAQARHLRIAALWGDTILAAKVLQPGAQFGWQTSLGVAPPDNRSIPEMPVRGAAGSWEIDPRGAIAGVVKLRGRDEDVAGLARAGAPLVLVAGDVALLQYGAFALFAQPIAPAPIAPGGGRIEPWIAFAFGLSAVGHFGLGYAIQLLSTPLPIPEPLELLSDRRLRDELSVVHLPDREEEKPADAGDKASGSKTPDKSNRDMSMGKKMKGAEGKYGADNGKGETRTTGPVPGALQNTLADVLGSGAGASLTDTLHQMPTVASLVGGMNAKDFNVGLGGGMGFKGGGSGGGGNGADGVPYGAGGVSVGVRPGGSGGPGSGHGGPGGTGPGGSGPGGERKISQVLSGGGGSPNFSADEIRRVVNAHAGAIRACYDSARDSDPTLRGSVSVSWHISGDGHVPRATIASSTLHNARAEGCITRVYRGMVFKNPDAIEAEASWSYQLAPP